MNVNTIVTKEEILQAAEELQAANENPTIKAIRQHLGHGSNTTIHKYLSQWKRLKQDKLENNKKDSLEQKLDDSKQQLKQQQRQNQQLTKELLVLERKLVITENQLKETTLCFTKQTEAYQQLQLNLEAAEKLNEEIKAERQHAFDQLLHQQQQLITQFQQDVKQINQECLEKVSDLNIKNQDAWLEEKVTNKQLIITISELNDQVYKLEKQIEEEHNKNAPLRKKLAMQEEFISKNLTSHVLGLTKELE